MTELNDLVLEFARRINSHGMNGLDEGKNKFLVEELNKKYSVTLRNTDSSADNNQVEQSITEQELVSKIEDMIDKNLSIKFISTGESLNDYSGYNQITGCKKLIKELTNLFQTYRNAVSKPVNKDNDILVNKE